MGSEDKRVCSVSTSMEATAYPSMFVQNMEVNREKHKGPANIYNQLP
jgi:hypothetical protein